MNNENDVNCRILNVLNGSYQSPHNLRSHAARSSIRVLENENPNLIKCNQPTLGNNQFNKNASYNPNNSNFHDNCYKSEYFKHSNPKKITVMAEQVFRASKTYTDDNFQSKNPKKSNVIAAPVLEPPKIDADVRVPNKNTKKLIVIAEQVLRQPKQRGTKIELHNDKNEITLNPCAPEYLPRVRCEQITSHQNSYSCIKYDNCQEPDVFSTANEIIFFSEQKMKPENTNVLELEIPIELSQALNPIEFSNHRVNLKYNEYMAIFREHFNYLKAELDLYPYSNDSKDWVAINEPPITACKHYFMFGKEDLEVLLPTLNMDYLFYRKKYKHRYKIFIIHKTALVSNDVIFGDKCIVMNYARIYPHVSFGCRNIIGRNVIINRYSTFRNKNYFLSNVEINSFVSIGTGNLFMPNCLVGRRVHLKLKQHINDFLEIDYLDFYNKSKFTRPVFEYLKIHSSLITIENNNVFTSEFALNNTLKIGSNNLCDDKVIFDKYADIGSNQSFFK